MQKFAVVFFPTIHIDTIDTFRAKYDAHWHIIPPHITIVSPISDISENQFIEHIEMITKDVKSFSIQLTGLSKSFDDYLFLQVKEGHEEIVNLHDKLYSEILAASIPTDFSFDPHITLGFFRTKDNTFDDALFTRAFTEAQDFNIDITCDFDAVSLIKGDGLSPAIVVKKIALLHAKSTK